MFGGAGASTSSGPLAVTVGRGLRKRAAAGSTCVHPSLRALLRLSIAPVALPILEHPLFSLQRGDNPATRQRTGTRWAWRPITASTNVAV